MSDPFVIGALVTMALALFILVVSAILQLTDTMPATTRAFKNIEPGEIFFDGDTRYRKLGRSVADTHLATMTIDGELLHNAVRADGENRSTAYFAGTDRFEVSLPIEMRCALWRRILVRYSLGWQVNGSPRRAKIAWRAARILSSERVEMALAAYAGSVLILGDQ